MRIKANGITFNYEIEGPEGAPWIMFSNSLATNLSMWNPQAADFKGAFRVLRYDQRGHGATEAPAGRYTYPQLIADALGLLDALEIERTHFVGLSMGGATAMALAELHADRVDHVVVCDSPCMSTPATAQQWEERIATAQKGGMEALVDSTLARWFPPETIAAKPAHVERVRAMILTTPVNGFVGWLGRAVGPQLQRRGRHRVAAGAVHRRQQGRRHPGGDEGYAEAPAGVALCRARGRWAHLESRPPGRVHQGGAGISRSEMTGSEMTRGK